MSKSWSLIAHGGAKNVAVGEEQANRSGLKEAVEIGMKILADGGHAIDAVVEVVKNLEKNPAYNAGLYGSVKNEDGDIELDASIMDGATLDIGAVAGLQYVEYPIMVARALLKEKPIFLVGEGAQTFAKKHGFVVKPEAQTKTSNSPGCDTVGCVARDQSGSLAVGTSTGGLEGTVAGRVGDVPLPGCGFYADNKRGGVSASGDGESIARVMLAAEFLHNLKNMDANAATAEALKLLTRVKGEAGLIALAPDGEIGWSHTSTHFAVGMANQDDKAPKVYLQRSEEK